MIESAGLDGVQVKVHLPAGPPGEEEDATPKLGHSEFEGAGLHCVGAVTGKAKFALQFSPVTDMSPRQRASDVFDHQNQGSEPNTKFAYERQEIVTRVVRIAAARRGEPLTGRASEHCSHRSR
jgi:hypothetical protein